MKTITPTELRGNIYQILDDILNTGVPVKINKGDRQLIIAPIESIDKLQNLRKRKNVIKGDSEELVHITWDKEVNLDLP